MCLLRWITDRLNKDIPLTQAAYQTTETIFTFINLTEKVLTSSKYETHTIMLDMGKAFDSVEDTL